MQFREGDRINHYTLLNQLGAGGQGSVWRVVDPRDGGVVRDGVDPELDDHSHAANLRKSVRIIARLPTIVTGNGGPKFLVKEGVTGFVAHEPEIFIRRIDELLMDPAKRASMSMAAREFALGISWDSIFEKVYIVYGHALHTASNRRASIITTDASRTRR